MPTKINKHEDDCPPPTTGFNLGTRGEVWPPSIGFQMEPNLIDVKFVSRRIFIIRMMLYCIYRAIINSLILVSCFAVIYKITSLPLFSIIDLKDILIAVVAGFIIGVIFGVIGGSTAVVLSWKLYDDLSRHNIIYDRFRRWIPIVLIGPFTIMLFNEYLLSLIVFFLVLLIPSVYIALKLLIRNFIKIATVPLSETD